MFVQNTSKKIFQENMTGTVWHYLCIRIRPNGISPELSLLFDLKWTSDQDNGKTTLPIQSG